MSLQQSARQQLRRGETTEPRALADKPIALLVSPHDAVHARLDGIETFSLVLDGRALTMQAALPRRYCKSRRRQCALLILLEAGDLFGSAVEMSRLLAGSREVQECIVVDASGIAAGDARALAALVAACRRRYRVSAGQVALFGHGSTAEALLGAFAKGIAGAPFCIVGSAAPIKRQMPTPAAETSIAWTIAGKAVSERQPGISWKLLPEASAVGLAIPALLHGLRTFWGRAHQYGDEVMPLTHAAIHHSARALAPLLRRLARRPVFAPNRANPQVVRAQAMGRDFEVFVALPQGIKPPQGGFPLLIALDANGGFATVVETVARLARAGETEPAIVVGIGTPRAEGDLEFGFRRFEELSPPMAADYRFDDVLGRFFRALFALRGQDARVQLGQAPAFHDFIASELLPQLLTSLPVNAQAVSLLGHSAAGTFVAYALAQPQSPFSGFLCLSPGVAISGGWMMRNAASSLAQRGRPAKLFVALGGEELHNRFNGIAGIPETLPWVQRLRAHGLPDAKCHVLQGETHTTVYPRALAQGLRAILPRA